MQVYSDTFSLRRLWQIFAAMMFVMFGVLLLVGGQRTVLGDRTIQISAIQNPWHRLPPAGGVVIRSVDEK